MIAIAYDDFVETVNNLTEEEKKLCDGYMKLNPEDRDRERIRDAILEGINRVYYEMINRINARR